MEAGRLLAGELNAVDYSDSMAVAYGYDTASRLNTVGDGAYSAKYTYLANSPLVSQITLKQSSTVRLTTTKQYDFLNRLASINSAPAAARQLPLLYGYAYNDGNQRVRATLTDGSLWLYTQDKLRCVEAANAFGRGLHSLQDRSAHRNRPEGGKWSSTVAHLGWWDSWDDEELRRMCNGVFWPFNPHAYPHEGWWKHYHRHHPDSPDDYDTWRGDSAGQINSQYEARRAVVRDSQIAIEDFLEGVRKSCVCRSEMLR